MKLIATLVLASGLTSFVQEEKPKEDGKAALLKAVEDTVAAGGYRFDGEVTSVADVAVMGGMFPGGGGDLTGKFSGTVTADGTVVVKLEVAGGTFELFKQGRKAVRRYTWTGKAAGTDEFVAQISAFLDFASLGAQVKRLRGVKPAAGGAYELKFQPDYVEGEKPEKEEGAGGVAMLEFEMMQVDRVDAQVHVAVETGRVKKIEMTVVKTLNEDVVAGAPEIESRLKYVVNLTAQAKDLKADVPEDVLRLLK